MGLNEEIQEFNRRIGSLEKKQEEVKRTLAVEEHKLKELTEQLQAEGYDVSKLSDAEIETLMEKLSREIEVESERLEAVLTEAEKHFDEFSKLR